MTAKEYATKLDEHLASLLERFKSGTYWAPPVRRVHIPKGDGTTIRPIGIPTFEDKVLQRTVTMVMEAVYEQDFLDCWWGFRPGRSAHREAINDTAGARFLRPPVIWQLAQDGVSQGEGHAIVCLAWSLEIQRAQQLSFRTAFIGD